MRTPLGLLGKHQAKRASTARRDVPSLLALSKYSQTGLADGRTGSKRPALLGRGSVATPALSGHLFEKWAMFAKTGIALCQRGR